MPKGGILAKKDTGSLKHLYKAKWRLGKTTVIRVPEKIKYLLLELAQKLDDQTNDNFDVIRKLDQYDQLKTEINLLKKQNILLQNELNVLKSKSSENKYKIAVDCFVEFVESQNLNIEELHKEKKATKKYQLWVIKNWFESKFKNTNC